MNRQQNIFTYILITAMIWNVLYVPLTYAYYYADQSYFIAQFCDNIDKPEMKCNGKCHLKEVTEKNATYSDWNNIPRMGRNFFVNIFSKIK